MIFFDETSFLDVEELGRKLGYTTDNQNFHNISLGQNQEDLAENSVKLAAAHGHWVILQNVHLMKKWLPLLEKLVESLRGSSHEKYRMFISGQPAGDSNDHIIPPGLLESSIKITNEAPSGVRANLHKALDNFSQESLEVCSRQTELQSILFALCYFHAVVCERRRFGSQGWTSVYPFNAGDLKICANVLRNYLDISGKVPWEDLRYLFGEIMYGGHITNNWDRKLCRTFLQVYIRPELLDGDMQIAPGFLSPPNMNLTALHNYIDRQLPPESPMLYGLHLNSEIGHLTSLSDWLFGTLLELQPRESSDGDLGLAASWDEKVKQIIDDLMEKLPEAFNMVDITGRVEDKTPFVFVALQECERMNKLISEIRSSLKQLQITFSGELTMTDQMQSMAELLFLEQVPHSWSRLCHPSLLNLPAWFSDQLMRVRQLENWTVDFQLPGSVWLSGFFNPQSFLTAIMQSTARRMETPLDRMCLQFEVTKKSKEDITSAPRDGVNVHGLFMEGARWDSSVGSIVDSDLNVLFPQLPVIFIRAITQDKQHTWQHYECPVYKTRSRADTYVWTFMLRSRDPVSKWILASVALLMQV